MKRFIRIMIFLLVLGVAAGLGVRPAVIAVARRQITAAFAGSSVSIARCEIFPFERIELYGIGIKKDGVYKINIAEAFAYYSLASIARRVVPKVVLADVAVTTDFPRQRALGLWAQDKFSPASGAWSVEIVDIRRAAIEFKAADISLSAAASAVFSPLSGAIDSVEIKLASLAGSGLVVENGLLKTDSAAIFPKLSVESLGYDKVRVENIQSVLRYKDGILFLDALSAKAFGGRIAGYATLRLAALPEYLIDVEVTDLDLEKFAGELGAGEKFNISGLASGRLIVSGTGEVLSALSGDFTTAKTGGALTINDTRFLSHMAGRSGQPMEIIVDSFRNYHYNTGTARLSLEKGNLLMEAALDGPAGKRNLNVTVHDINLKKDGL